MHLPLSLAVAPGLIVLDEVASTNTELVRLATTGGAKDFAVLATTNQTAGRGRLGRTWTAPPGATLAVSVLATLPAGDLARIGWMPLLAGLAMARAVASLLPRPDAVGLKWPNDVQVGGRKVSGLLCEVIPDGLQVVIGAGLNLTMTEHELPVPTATSLVLSGASPEGLLDRALAAYLTNLHGLIDDFTSSTAEPGPGLRTAVLGVCTTIGRSVRVELPDGTALFGTAVDIDAGGHLIVRELRGSALQPVAAGDVTHLRYE